MINASEQLLLKEAWIDVASVAGVVVTYQPDPQQLHRTLAALASQVDTIFVVDNSDTKIDMSSHVSEFPGVRIIDNGGNQGIAHALNRGLQEAQKAGATWLVTLDQDSSLPAGYVSAMAAYLNGRSDRKGIAIIGADYYTEGVREAVKRAPGADEAEYLITSGNLVNVSTVLAIGGFREDFFIDYVDVELCFRLRKLGFKIIQHPTVFFAHELGATQRTAIGSYSFLTSHHSAVRRYYMTRNRIVFYKEYLSFSSKFVMNDLFQMTKEVIKVVLIEKNTVKKIKAVALGTKDALTGKLGKSRYKF